MSRTLVAVLLAIALSGCVAEDVADDPAPQEQIQYDENRPDPTFGDVVTGPEVGPDLNATTEAAPRLIEGEWWRIRYSNLFTGGDVEFVRVVANVTDEGYIFGMPHSGWFKEAIAYHAPAFGDVNLDLSYNTHNVLFEPVRFPLTEGATWETAFATTPLTAVVESADETTATVVFSAPEGSAQPTDPVFEALGLAFTGEQMRLTYDATMHEVVRMESGIGTWEVIAHGYDFEGWVTVPRGEHTAIDYGVLGPASDTHTPLPREIVVDGGFNRLTMMHLIIPLGPGSFTVRSTTPNGTVFETTNGDNMAGDAWVIRFYEASDPDGTWLGEDVIIGPAATYSMGIAYHQFDIRLPDQLRRADHSHEVIR